MFFDVLREKNLLVPPLPKSPRTTRFEPSLPVFRNLVADLELTGPNRAWAADITYVRTDEGFLYLSLITDMWSRKIVGFHAGSSLATKGALSALSMALSSLKGGEKPVHHSDRGCQYASHLYVGALRKAGLQVNDGGVALLRKRNGRTGERDTEAGILHRLLLQEQGSG